MAFEHIDIDEAEGLKLTKVYEHGWNGSIIFVFGEAKMYAKLGLEATYGDGCDFVNLHVGVREAVVDHSIAELGIFTEEELEQQRERDRQQEENQKLQTENRERQEYERLKKLYEERKI